MSVLFTIPSIAFYLILLNVTGRGFSTAVVVLTAYTLVLIYRNVITGLQEVPRDMVDAAEGMGLTRRQILFRVELPMALPTIFAGLRIAASSTVGIAGFAFFAGAGGLGEEIFADPTFRGNVVTASLLMILLATVLELIVLVVQRVFTPWERAVTPMSTFAALGPFGDAIEFIFQERESQAGTVRVGGLGEMWELTWTHLKLSLAATLDRHRLIAMPLGIWLGHIGRYQFLATSTSNIGRAVPALGLVVFFIAFLGVGFVNVCVALVLLAIPPIITNAYVGIRGVDPETVDAARGQRPDRAPGRAAGRAAARPADDHGRHPHLARVGDRHRHDRAAGQRRHARAADHQPERLRHAPASSRPASSSRSSPSPPTARSPPSSARSRPRGLKLATEPAAVGRPPRLPVPQEEHPDNVRRTHPLLILLAVLCPRPRVRRLRRRRGAAVLAAPSSSSSARRPARRSRRSTAPRATTITVGSKNFTEQFVLGEIYSQALEAAGFKVKRQLNLGSELIAYKALQAGKIDAYPEYTGTALTSFFGVKTADVPTRRRSRPTRTRRRASPRRTSPRSPRRRSRTPTASA